jgi:hypothetical protein
VNLLLAFLMICLGAGLYSATFGQRQQVLVSGLAALVTLLYLFFPARFM